MTSFWQLLLGLGLIMFLIGSSVLLQWETVFEGVKAGSCKPLEAVFQEAHNITSTKFYCAKRVTRQIQGIGKMTSSLDRRHCNALVAMF